MPATEEAARALARGVAALGLDALPWSKALAQWRERVMFLRRAEGEEWPDLSDAALAATIEDWLAPHLVGKAGLADIAPDELAEALRALLPWALQRRLDAEAPTHVEVPTGSRIAIDYGAEEGPVLAVRVQELFGLRPASDDRRRPRAARAPPALAGAAPDPDHPRPAGLLARLLGGGPGRHARPIPEAPLARGPARRRADPAGEAAGNVSLSRRASRSAARPWRG